MPTWKIEFEVMRPDNKKVLKHYLVRAGRDPHSGGLLSFTKEGVEKVLESFITQFDDANPNHQYRLVDMGRARFRLVHAEPEKNNDPNRDQIRSVQAP